MMQATSQLTVHRDKIAPNSGVSFVCQQVGQDMMCAFSWAKSQSEIPVVNLNNLICQSKDWNDQSEAVTCPLGPHIFELLQNWKHSKQCDQSSAAKCSRACPDAPVDPPTSHWDHPLTNGLILQGEGRAYRLGSQIPIEKNRYDYVWTVEKYESTTGAKDLYALQFDDRSHQSFDLQAYHCSWPAPSDPSTATQILACRGGPGP